MTLDTARIKAAINDGDQFDSDLVLRLLDEIDRLNAVIAELTAHLVVANGVIDTWGRALNRMYVADL